MQHEDCFAVNFIVCDENGYTTTRYYLVADVSLQESVKKETVNFREEVRILTIVDRVAGNQGQDRSSLYRRAMRFFLASNSHLSEQEKKDILGGQKEA